MPYRVTKVYTRKGDDGYTTLGDHRIPKDDLLVEAIGTLDELNSCIGVILALQPEAEITSALTRIQNELFDMGGELHMPEYKKINQEHIVWLEQQIDAWNANLPPLKEFVLPNGNPLAASTHVARTVCRRAERNLVKLHRQIALENTSLLKYLNRLSDLLFVVARVLARSTNPNEQLWEHERKKR